MQGHNPISFCNVLFAGNMCALGVAIVVHRHKLNVKECMDVTKLEWISLTLSAILSGAIIPAMIFQALALSPVNNIILLARIELPLILIASIVILKEQFTRN